MEKSNFKTSFKHFARNNSAIISLMIMLVIGYLINSRDFLTVRNLVNVTRQSLTNGLIAFGMTFVILCGSIDMSVSAILPLGTFISLYCSNYSIVLALVCPLIAGTLVGAINGLLVGKMKLPAMIATLAMQLALRGLIHVLTNNAPYRPQYESPVLKFLGSGNVFGFLPAATICFAIAFLVMAYLLKYQPSLRNVYAVGGNKEAALMMGINVDRTILYAHMVCGFMAGFAGIIMGTRTGAALPLAGDGYEMLAIASAVIGGVFMSGGRGKMSGTLIGTLVVGLLANVFKMQDVLSAHSERALTGAVLLVVLLIQSFNGGGIDTVKRRIRVHPAK